MNDRLLTFGAFELNWKVRQLFCNGEPVAVEPKALELIHYLLLHRDRAVGKDELAEALWPNRVISDTVISQTVRKARAAVNDDGERQAVIATVRGFGYRFVAQLGEQATAGAATGTQQVPGKRRAWLLAPVLALIVLAVLLALDPKPASAPLQRSVAVAPVEIDLPPDEAPSGASSLDSLIRYALAGAPQSTLLGPVDPGADEPVGDPVSWIQSVLGADEVILPTLHLAAGQWVITATVIDRQGQTAVYQARADQIADGIHPLIRQLQRHYRVGQDLLELRLFDDPWMNEALARSIHALEGGDPGLALSTTATLLELDPEHAWTQYFQAVAQRQLGEHDLAQATLNMLLEQFEPTREQPLDPALGWSLHNSLGIIHHLAGEPDIARIHFIDAARMAEISGDQRQLAQALVSRGIMEASLGDEALASTLYSQALEAFNRIGYLPGRALVANSLGARAWRSGDVEASGSWHREALDIRRQIGRRSEIAQSLINLSTVKSARLEFEAARRLLDEAILLGESYGLADMHAWATVQLGHLQYRTDEKERAYQTFHHGLVLAEEIGYQQAIASALGGLGRLAVHEQDHDEARALLLEALRRFEDMSHVRTRILDAWLDLAELALGFEQLDEAESWLALSGSDMDQSGRPDWQGARYLQLRAELSLQQGNPELAEQKLRDGLRMALRVNHLQLRQDIAYALASLLEDQSRQAEAHELLDTLPDHGPQSPGRVTSNGR